MTHSRIARLGATVALAGLALAACNAGGASPAASSVPSTVAESPAASSPAAASPAASASAMPSAAAASPAARTVEVYAIDGGFQNAPIDPTPGTVLTFRNLGTEAHEMVVIRRNDDATDKQTFDDLSKVQPADLLTFVTVVGALAADPGQVAEGQVDITQAGDYAIVDLLAKGTTTAPASPDPMAIPTGVPNVVNGMWTTFTAIEPEAS